MSPLAAHADGETDRALAQQLFDDARKLVEDKRYAEACPKFAESQRLDPGGGTLLNLAVCHELEGRTATAWSEFHDALAMAGKDGRKDREDLANTHIADLAPRLVRIVVHVPPALAARRPVVAIDGSELQQAAWETTFPIDPGEHRVTMTLPASEPWSTVVAATEPGRTYAIELPPFVLPPSLPPEALLAGEPRRSAAFYALLGVGGGLLVTSAITGLVALNANAYVDDHCNQARDFCRVNDAHDASVRGVTFAWISTAALAGGLVAGGAAFLLPKTRNASVRIGLGTLAIDVATR
jgi:hypothetical protein